MAAPLRIGVIAGEESGDLLAADLLREVARQSGRTLELVGVGGNHLASLGLRSLFDPDEISLMGVGAVVANLPRLLHRIRSLARALATAELDALLTVDVPDFSLRVASRVRKAKPGIPAIHYVCPSVWAWRPERAVRMRSYVDHILCLLPFEPEALERLDGPPGTYVGHRLSHDPDLLRAHNAQQAPKPTDTPTLLVLPGSRRSEVKRLLPDFRETVSILYERGNRFRLVIPTTERVRLLVEEAVSNWPHRPEVVVDAAEKIAAMGEARAALAASGTVSLELALAGVPHVTCYRLDAVSRAFRYLVTTWSANLPNLIADRPIVPEFIDETVRAPNLARQVEALAADSTLRRWQLEGFGEVRRRLETARPAGAIGAEVLLGLLRPLKT